MDTQMLTIANYLRDAFAGTPAVHRYFAADNVRYVDIIKTPHDDNVTYLGTIGCSNRKMKGQPAKQQEIRVELISAVEAKYTEIMAETLGFLTFCLDTDKAFYHPGVVVENAIPESPITKMRHVYLCDPFLWEDGLPSIRLEKYPVAFLYVMPITNEEYQCYLNKGINALEALLQKNDGVDYPNLARG